jgi:hypothetical protein
MIDPSTFVDGHTFSFQAQPYLRDLFQAVRDEQLPLVLVLGAGVSMNASLPSWSSLLARMTDAIDDEPLRRVAMQDSSDPMRKAEIILNLVKQNNLNAQDHEIIRDALYSKTVPVVPGQLASSIARLIYIRRGNVKVLTTNFDNIIEKALERYCTGTTLKSYSIGDVEGWENWNETPGNVGVLHLHGLVRQRDTPEEPIILTESQFLKHGLRVRTAISDAIASACTIFVGLSMSDPNLVGPLYQSANTASPRFALVVPGQAAGADSPKESVRYAISSARYLEEKLGLKPIFLKSYSQLNQVISDLALAVKEPDRYVPDNESADSLVYGNRLKRALDLCYSAIGCSNSDWFPVGAAGEAFSARLHEALSISDGPINVLRRMAQRYKTGPLGGLEGENFGLSLWLRTRDEVTTKERYTLGMVGTSAYAHREEWSMRREVAISPDSQFTAAQAVFQGSWQAANVTPSPNSRIWRGIVAAPVLLVASGSDQNIKDEPADILTVGAITLNSTHLVTESKDAPSGGASEYSIITRLKSADYVDLISSLQVAAEYALSLA